MILGLGIDLFPIARLERELGRWGSDFLGEFLSEAELAASSTQGWTSGRIAASFAGKEAIFKTLGTGRTPEMRWADIEILPVGPPPQRSAHLFATCVHSSKETPDRSSASRIHLHGAVRSQALTGLADPHSYRLSLELDFFGDHARAIAIAESSPHCKGGPA